jgi:hypothetical protein
MDVDLPQSELFHSPVHLASAISPGKCRLTESPLGLITMIYFSRNKMALQTRGQFQWREEDHRDTTLHHREPVLEKKQIARDIHRKITNLSQIPESGQTVRTIPDVGINIS